MMNVSANGQLQIARPSSGKASGPSVDKIKLLAESCHVLFISESYRA